MIFFVRDNNQSNTTHHFGYRYPIYLQHIRIFRIYPQLYICSQIVLRILNFIMGKKETK